MKHVELDLMTLEGVVLLPKAILPLNIFEPRYTQMLSESLEGNRTFAVCNIVGGRPAACFGLGLIKTSIQNKDGSYQLLLEGVSRYRIQNVLSTDPVLRVAGELLVLDEDNIPDRELRNALEGLLHQVGERYPQVATTLYEILKAGLSDVDFCDLTTGTIVGDSKIKQMILDSASIEKRLTLLHDFLDTARLN